MVGPFQLTTLLIALVGSAAEEPLLRKPHDIFSSRHKKAKDKYATEPPEQPTCNACPTYDNRDWTNRVGLGESPGIPNLEYLGLGYNIFEGNPRGSDITEVDPGFRSPVVKLRQEQTTLTIDQEYMVPLGVDVRYITACKFASEATELSNESEYRSEVSKEASQKTEISGGISAGLFSVSAEYAFSSSSKYKQFVDTSKATQTVTYEARALCSEFKASFKPYYSHVFDDTFQMALDNLPYPYDKEDMRHKREYKQFLDSFGTHYISDVTLGAKHVFSSVMKSEDVSELSRSDIDISSSLSWSVQASFGSGGQGNTDYGQLVRSEAEAKVKENVTAKTYSYVFEEASVGGKVSSESELSEKSSQSNQNRVRSKVKTVQELNVGGNPPENGNWKTWATTVRDRPMPISYEIEGVWNLMANETVREAFYDALLDIYNLDVKPRKDSTIVNALRFGVSRGDGMPISSYSRDPSANYRGNLRLTSTAGVEVKEELTGNLFKLNDAEIYQEEQCPNNKGGTWTDFEDVEGYFACGLAIATKGESGLVVDGTILVVFPSVAGLKVTYCSQDNWETQTTRIIHEQTENTNFGSVTMCNQNEYIAGIAIGYAEPLAILVPSGFSELSMKCAQLPLASGDNPPEPTSKTVADLSTTQATQSEYTRSDQNLFMKSIRVKHCATPDKMGLFGLGAKFEEPNESGGNTFASYVYEVPRDVTAALVATPVRGSVGEHTQEDEDQIGFSIYSPQRDEQYLGMLSHYPFGVFESNMAKIVVQDFKQNAVRKDMLQSLSFVSGENLPTEANYVAGVVHPLGYAVNDNFRDDDVGFMVSQVSDEEYRVRFPSLTNPTFFAFPLWFPGASKIFPKQIDSVVAATRYCNQGDGDMAITECLVTTGADGDSSANAKLGFSFIALDGFAREVSGIIHGVVTVESSGWGWTPPSIASFSGSRGFTAEAVFQEERTTFEVKGGVNNDEDIEVEAYGGGILITFDEPFRGLPAVIVNPIIGSRDLTVGAVDEFALPSAVVEHITEGTAFVKVDWVDTTGEFKSATPIAFHIMVVGPQRDPYVPPAPTMAPSSSAMPSSLPSSLSSGVPSSLSSGVPSSQI